MHLVRLYVVAVVLLVAGGGASCGSDEADSGIFDIAFTLRDSEGREAATFPLGAPITFELAVRNRTGREQTIPFRSGQTFEFQVLPHDSESPLWAWSTGVLFTQAQRGVSFEPGQRRLFSAVWDQVADDGAAIGPGAFDAQGFLVVLGGPGLRPLEDPRVGDLHALEFTVQ